MVRKFKSRSKIFIKDNGKVKKGTFIKYSKGQKNVAIVKEVGKINKQGYSIARPFGTHISFIKKRKLYRLKVGTYRRDWSPFTPTSPIKVDWIPSERDIKKNWCPVDYNKPQFKPSLQSESGEFDNLQEW